VKASARSVPAHLDLDVDLDDAPQGRSRQSRGAKENQRYHQASARSLPSRSTSVEFRRDRDVGTAEDILHDAQIARFPERPHSIVFDDCGFHLAALMERERVLQTTQSGRK
jgi:hypothetical protein